MGAAVASRCCCPCCRAEPDHAEWAWHQQLHLLLARLDAAQRRWYVAVEANRLGRGGARRLAAITGLDEKTIRRGQRDLASALATTPPGRVRRAGGGRPPVEKRTRPS
jgi:hypothetical protein